MDEEEEEEKNGSGRGVPKASSEKDQRRSARDYRIAAQNLEIEPFFAEFDPVSLDIEGLVDAEAARNREAFQVNQAMARDFARTLAGETADEFDAFLDDLLPGAAASQKESLAFARDLISGGLPDVYRNNALLRDANRANVTGARGEIAARQSLFNEYNRDFAAVQYGIGLASNLWAQSAQVAGGFASVFTETAGRTLGELNAATMFTPAQRVGTEVGIAQFNAANQFAASQFNAGAQTAAQGANAELLFSNLALELESERAADASRGGLLSGLGAIAGLGAAALVPGVGAAGLMVGMGAGQAVGGAIGGNYAGISGGLQTAGMGLGMMNQNQMAAGWLPGGFAGAGTPAGYGYGPSPTGGVAFY